MLFFCILRAKLGTYRKVGPLIFAVCTFSYEWMHHKKKIDEVCRDPTEHLSYRYF